MEDGPLIQSARELLAGVAGVCAAGAPPILYSFSFLFSAVERSGDGEREQGGDRDIPIFHRFGMIFTGQKYFLQDWPSPVTFGPFDATTSRTRSLCC